MHRASQMQHQLRSEYVGMKKKEKKNCSATGRSIASSTTKRDPCDISMCVLKQKNNNQAFQNLTLKLVSHTCGLFVLPFDRGAEHHQTIHERTDVDR